MPLIFPDGHSLPSEIGTPAGNTRPEKRFLITPYLMAAQKALLPEILSDEGLPSVGRAMDMLNQAKMPPRAGRVALGGAVGSFDLQALRLNDGDQAVVEVVPQAKSAIDEDTKEPREPGALVFSIIRALRGGSLAVDSKVMGVAINPDEEPWLADDLGIDPQSKQNQYGLVIATIVPFAASHFILEKTVLPDNNNSNHSGTLILPKVSY